MPPLRDSFKACAPASLEHSPPLPTVPRKGISASRHGPRGPSGHRLSQCQSWGGHHRGHHACGNRHWPPCPHHTTQQWFHHHLDPQLPGPHCLLTCTVPETLRPFLRSQPRLASHALVHAAALALKRLAKDARCIGTDLPGCTGGLPPWGRPLQSHPHLPSLGPGGGLAEDRTPWVPARAHVFVPGNALSPISRAIVTDEMRQAGRREHLAPHVWPIPWHVPRQANPHGHSACTSLAPSVCRVAIAHRRIVGLTDRTVTFPSRQVGRARLRTAHRDAIECLRRFLQPVLPDGFVQVRPCGLLHARCALPLATIRLMIVPAHPSDGPPPPRRPPPPLALRCPTCGAPMRVVMRRWTSHHGFVDTG